MSQEYEERFLEGDDGPTAMVPDEKVSSENKTTGGAKDKKVAAPQPTASIATTAINIILNVIGGGLLAVPVSFDQTSIIPGIFLLFLMASLSLYSMVILIFCAQKTNLFSYKELLTKAYSEKIGKLFDLILIFYTYGILVSYGKIVGDTMKDVAIEFFKARGFYITTEFWILVSACVFLPLSSVKQLSGLKWSSALGFLTILYLGFMVFFRFFGGKYAERSNSLIATDIDIFRIKEAFIRAIPVLSTAFCCHYNIPVFYGELSNRTPKRMFSTLKIFAFFSVPFYLAFGLVAYLMFGHARLASDQAGGDVLNVFDVNDEMFNVARFGFWIQFLASYPLVCLACRRNLNVLVFGDPNQSQQVFIMEATVLVVTSCILAYLVPSIDDVFTINGALFGLSIVVIIPSAIFLKIFPKVDPKLPAHLQGLTSEDVFGSPPSPTVRGGRGKTNAAQNNNALLDSPTSSQSLQELQSVEHLQDSAELEQQGEEEHQKIVVEGEKGDKEERSECVPPAPNTTSVELVTKNTSTTVTDDYHRMNEQVEDNGRRRNNTKTTVLQSTPLLSPKIQNLFRTLSMIFIVLGIVCSIVSFVVTIVMIAEKRTTLNVANNQTATPSF